MFIEVLRCLLRDFWSSLVDVIEVDISFRDGRLWIFKVFFWEYIRDVWGWARGGVCFSFRGLFVFEGF